MANSWIYRTRRISVFLLLLCHVPLAVCDLKSEYEAKTPQLEVSQFSLPILMESSVQGRLLKTVIFGRLEHSYELVLDQLSNPAAWCGMMFLHLNTKACVHQTRQGRSTVTIYMGNKEYQPISETKPLSLTFVAKVETAEGQLVKLQSEQGPYHTSDYLIVVEVAPLESCCTIIKFQLSFKTNPLIQSLANLYLTVFARNKVGFTRIDTTRDGNPVYVSGMKSVLERNALRNYLAVTTFLDTLGENRERRFERWFDATAKYDQLKELSKSDYLKYKKMEYRQQVAAQMEVAGP